MTTKPRLKWVLRPEYSLMTASHVIATDGKYRQVLASIYFNQTEAEWRLRLPPNNFGMPWMVVPDRETAIALIEAHFYPIEIEGSSGTPCPTTNRCQTDSGV